MNDSNQNNASTRQFSLLRLMSLLAVVAVVAYGSYWYGINSVKPPSEEGVMMMLGLGRPVQNKLDGRYQDSNGDLLADSPQDEAQWIDPEVLTFSYLASSGQEHYQEVWADFLKHLSEQTSKPTQYLALNSAEEQLQAIKEGRLHVSGLNPGTVPVAVNSCGFLPVCGLGRNDQLVTYTMTIVASKESHATQVKDLSGQTLALTYPTSNSGCKAPLMILQNEFQLVPVRDYSVVFSHSHENSLQGIASGFYRFAAVASDETTLAIEHGQISKDQFQVIYKSEPFPSNMLGHVHNLAPELAGRIREAFLNYPWKESALAKEFETINVTQFVPVQYKDHFQLVRKIDDTMGRQHNPQ